MATVVIALTAATIGNTGIWYAPVDCNGSITVELIGPGGRGGGAYTKNTLGAGPGKKFYVNFLENTWINTTNAVPTNALLGAKAAGASTSTGAGGLASACIPNILGVTFSGGNGPTPDFGNNSPASSSGQGCGGAAGPSGPGGNGVASPSLGTPGDGGSSNGHAVGYNGGTVSSPLGKKEVIYTDFAGNGYGPASGANGGNYVTSKSGNYYALQGFGTASGGGGYNPTPNNGLIIITYTPTQIPGTYTEVFVNPGTAPWRTPAGVISIKAEAIGGGGSGIGGGGYGGGPSGAGGGGGGAYAATTAITVSTGTIAYITVASSMVPGVGGGGDSWFNLSNSPPTTSTTGVLASGARSGASNAATNQGTAANSIGDTKFSGGSGGVNVRPDVYPSSAGGGGSGGPGGAGGRGGNDFGSYGDFSGGGGGGGAGGAAGNTDGASASGFGFGSTAATGGAGGKGSAAGTAAAGGTLTSPAAPGSAGGGGGGGGSNYTTGASGSVYPYWTNPIGEIFGPSGGGGGSGRTYSTTRTIPGAGGTYGGGGGGGGATGSGSTYNTTPGASGGQGLVVLTYTVSSDGAAASNNIFMMFF